MIAIVEDSTGAIVRIAHSTDGIDMDGMSVIDVPEGYDPMAASHFLVEGEWQLNVAARKQRMIAAANALAEVVRCRFLTPGSGQAITYARKEAEARAWESGADPNDFPFLSAEAAGTGATLADTAALVLAQADAWVTIGAAIEGNRRGLVVAIESAETTQDLDVIDIESGWPG